jgi:hypothetical protein
VKVRAAGLSLALIVMAAAVGVAPAAQPAATASPSPAPSAKPTPKLSKWRLHQLELYRNSAPADEYFGKLKMSYLGMNNTFHDASITAGDHTTNSSIVLKVAFAEDALEAWARKYPRDPQLARTYYLATRVDRKIWIKGNQDRAWVYLNRLVQLFPDTYFGKIVKRDLAIGFTEHYYMEPVPCPAPTDTPTPTPEPTASPTPEPERRGRRATPTPSPTDTPTPQPTPSPSPTPTVTHPSPHLTVVVLPQPCVPPATPSPTPTPMPTSTPVPVTPVPSASPLATTTPAH